jgi:4-amino-4-deoxy-L-arabinose transferase-like glycosyltransferase
MARKLKFSEFVSVGWQWKLVVIVLFLVGLCFRLVVFIEPHLEGDELIYKSLVVQLENGKGYTLQGSALLEKGRIDKYRYDHPLFFHPPGGIALFWLFYRLLGYFGLPLVQIFCYVLFFWSMMLLAGPLDISSSNTGLLLFAGLTAFNPIMAHVTTNFWLDGPLLAFSTLAIAVFIRAVVRKNYVWACIAGLILGYASLIKLAAFLVIPGVAMLAWFLIKPPKWRTFLLLGACLVVPAAIVQIPWEIWQWIKVGTAFPGWAGKPSQSLIENNKYVYYLTVIRPPWIYLTLLPRILWTLVPSIFLYFLLCDNAKIRWWGLSCLIWIAAILAAHIALGSMGYSKVVRYVILVVPASVALFSMVMIEAIARLRLGIGLTIRKELTWILTTTGALAFFIEIAAGILSSLRYKVDLILPIFAYL